MANELSTAGVLLKYKVESTAGTKPTGAFTTVPNIVSTGAMNNEPDNLEVTDLSDTVWRRYIPGLKDPGGAITFTANLTSAFKIAWETLVTATTTALASNKAMWFEIMVPSIGSFYFTGVPDVLGINAYEINAVNQIDVHIVPNTISGWSTSSSGN
jgi:hypothetical protein